MSNDTIENGTRDLPACSAVPKPAAPLRAPLLVRVLSEIACEVHKPLVSKFSFAGNSYITKNTQRLHKHCLGK